LNSPKSRSVAGGVLGIFVLFALLGASVDIGCLADEGLLYYVGDDGNVVITNTPNRKHTTRPVPGMERQPRRFNGSRLPVTSYDPYIETVAAELGLDPALIKAVALVESGFNPRAVSPKGAQGLMQLMPGTAKHYGVRDPFNPLENLRAGATHLRDLLARYDGDLKLALAAYNAGPTAVRRYGGVPAFRETRNYVDKVQGLLNGESRTRRAPREIPARSVQMVRRSDGTFALTN